MKHVYLLSFVILITFSVKSQCLPDGIEFTTQAQIDNFQTNYPNCTEIEGDVLIDGSTINNLNGLDVITTIGGDFVMHTNHGLANLTGLSALTTIGGDLVISNHENLSSLSGLNVSTVGGDLKIILNDNLADLVGLENLTSIGDDLQIVTNSSLANISGLASLESIGDSLAIVNNDLLSSLSGTGDFTIGGDLFIEHNNSLSACNTSWICNYLMDPAGVVIIDENAEGCSIIDVAFNCGGVSCLPYGDYFLHSQSDIDNFQLAFPECYNLNGKVTISGDDIVDLSGLQDISSVEGDLRISYNPSLKSLSGLENLSSTAYFFIGGNDSLNSMNGLDNLSTVALLHIWGNPLMADLSGMNSLTETGGGLYVSENNSLLDMTGLDQINSIGGPFFIEKNNSLTSVSGLENLTSISGHLEIIENNSLVDLSGFTGLYSAPGLNIGQNQSLLSLEGLGNINPSSLNHLEITRNEQLSACEVASICDFLAASNEAFIMWNAPGCNSQEQVEEACLNVPVEEVTQENNFRIYPNPASSAITVERNNNTEAVLSIIDLQGRQLIRQTINSSNNITDISGLPAGVYFVHLLDDNNKFVQKLMKN